VVANEVRDGDAGRVAECETPSLVVTTPSQ
jgi:hypothetical protein